jgi:hypothetical protein
MKLVNKRDNELDKTLQITQTNLAAKIDTIMEFTNERDNELGTRIHIQLRSIV